ncbi:MAG TPA: hypothetical protein PLQ76_05075, partial [bacterium]|nr:hypothetical protein [bacterium]
KHHVDMKTVSGEPAGSIYLHQRTIDGKPFLFFANIDKDKPVDATAILPYKGLVRSWNLFDGTEMKMGSTEVGGKTQVKLHFEPAGSVLLSVDPGAKPMAESQRTEKEPRTVNIPNEWKIVRRDPNSIIVDFIGYKAEENKNWSALLPQYSIQNTLESRGTGARFNLRYSFNIGVQPDTLKNLFFVMEQPDIYKMEMNGTPINYKDEGWWIDRSFKKISIKDTAKKGRNAFEVQGAFVLPRKPGTLVYTEDGVEVEAAYVTGDFKVKVEKGTGYQIQADDDSFSYGDLAKQGYPFFAGAMRIAQDVNIEPAAGEKVVLGIDGFNMITAEVFVNGKSAGVLALHPYTLDITRFVRKGANRLEIELIDSNRNLLGPHHDLQEEPLSVGPGSFMTTATKKYNLVPFGIKNGVFLRYEGKN